MTILTVILFGRAIPISCCTHIALLIEDPLTQRSFLVNYPFQQMEKTTQLMSQTLYGNIRKNTCCLKVIKLNSKKTFDEIKKNVPNDLFSWTSNNCSDQVYRLLDFAFDLQKERLNHLHTCYRWTCCLGWIASLGLLSCCFPAPPCINTPRDIISLAEWLSYKYGYSDHVPAKREEKKLEKKVERIPAETKPDPVEKFYSLLNRCGLS